MTLFNKRTHNTQKNQTQTDNIVMSLSRSPDINFHCKAFCGCGRVATSKHVYLSEMLVVLGRQKHFPYVTFRIASVDALSVIVLTSVSEHSISTKNQIYKQNTAHCPSSSSNPPPSRPCSLTSPSLSWRETFSAVTNSKSSRTSRQRRLSQIQRVLKLLQFITSSSR